MSGRGFRVNYKVPELQDVIRNIKNYDVKTAARIEGVVDTSTKNIGAGARRRVAKRSGKTQKRITTRFDKRKIEGEIASRTPQSHLLEFGANGAVVKPDNKKALTVGGKANGPLQPGHKHYAAKVTIPRRKEHPFMRPSYEDEKPALISGIKQAVRKP